MAYWIQGWLTMKLQGSTFSFLFGGGGGGGGKGGGF